MQGTTSKSFDSYKVLSLALITNMQKIVIATNFLDDKLQYTD